MRIFEYFWPFIKPFIFLGVLILIGSGGYMALEDWTFLDAVYMTVITVTTVGFGEVQKLSQNGKIFTIFLIIGGVLFYGAGLNALFKILLEKSFKTFMEEARMLEKIKKLKDHYIICGGGRMALAIARELERSKYSFVIIETNLESPVSASGYEWLILYKDALLEETLIEANIDKAKGLASVLPTDADNLFVVLSARRLNPGIRIETRIAKESTRQKMLQAGADKVVSPYAVGGLQIARSFTKPMVDDFLEIVLGNANYEFEMLAKKIDKEHAFLGKRIRDTDYRQKGYIIIGVKYEDGRMKFAPDSECELEEDCEVLLLGSGIKTQLD